jgi:hypothetical protein
MTDHRPPRRRGPLAVVALAAGFGWLPAAGCNSLRPAGERPEATVTATATEAPASTPGRFPLRLSQYVFYSDFPIRSDNPLLTELGDLREQVYKELQLPTSDNIIQVFLFEDRERYERFMRKRYPDLPRRRAFFVAQPRGTGGAEELLVYTFYGEHIRQDLRHELTHALLHSVLRDVPLWLDEGLAEFFELPPENDGVNPQHLDVLKHGAFEPDLTRLEELTQVEQMKPPEYREAWAWVHLMLRSRPQARVALLSYLQQLRAQPNPGPLLPRLLSAFPEPAVELERHIDQLDRQTAAMRVKR